MRSLGDGEGDAGVLQVMESTGQTRLAKRGAKLLFHQPDEISGFPALLGKTSPLLGDPDFAGAHIELRPA